MQLVLTEFANLLRRRLGQTHTSEDSMRYTFFSALVNNTNLQPHELILEYPHPKIPGAEVDTYIPSINDRKGLVLEFKYDRQIPSGKNSPRPQKAGKLFNDMFRLTKFNTDTDALRWFVYLTDTEMASYFRNRQNGLTDFFELPVGQELTINDQYINARSETFQKAIGGSFSARLRCVCSEALPSEHYLRIFEILPS